MTHQEFKVSDFPQLGSLLSLCSVL